MQIVISIVPNKPDELRILAKNCERLIHRNSPAFDVARSILGDWESIEAESESLPELRALFDPTILNIESELREMIIAGATTTQVVDWAKSYTFGMGELIEVVRILLTRAK